jgi:hypothetical protein
VTTTSLHEGLDWVYDLDGLYFIFYRNANNFLAYKMYRDMACTDCIGVTEWRSWGPEAIRALEGYSRSKLRPIIPFCGPVQPPPSAVVLKIRAMEKRRKQYA